MTTLFAQYIIAFVLVALLAVPALAQTAEEDEELFLQQAERAQTEISPDEAREEILQRLQDGEHQYILSSFLLSGFQSGGNFALINQQGEDNLAGINQVGLSNLAVMHQEGNVNTTEVDQLGNRNIFGAWLTGDNNQLRVSQIGDDNVYVLDFVGTDLDHTVTQQGDGIRAVQIGRSTRPFSIEQYGSGMDIRIEHN